MGIEYTLRTAQADQASVLLGLAVVQVEATSVYFRDNGDGRDFLGAVVAKLCSFGSVTVEEL
jgi:hypothetical protein